MLYDNYKRKILSVGQVLKVIIKFLPLIIIIASAITVISATLVATKGIVSDIDLPKKPIEYGDPIPCHASAFLSKVTYEYSTDNATWTDTYPNKPGKYYVRAVGAASFGGKRYSDVVAFEIHPREITVAVAQGGNFTYGSSDIYAIAADGDWVECQKFVFENIYEENEDAVTVDITPVKSSIRIYDSNNKDITDSHYNITVETMNVEVLKKPLNIIIQDQNEIYNGSKFEFDLYEFDQTALIEGDTLRAMYEDSIVDPGTQEIKPDFQIKKTNAVNADGQPVEPIDVTALYKLNVAYGTLTVEKRPLVIELKDLTAEYTGLPIEFNEYTTVISDSSLGLIEGHSIAVKENIVYPTDAAIHTNPTVFTVLDKDGNDVGDKYYSITQLEATIEITQHKMSVVTNSQSWVYDGEEHFDKGFSIEGLLNGHKTDVALPEGQKTTVSITDVGKLNNEFAIKILDNDGRDVTANYDLEYTYGALEILKREIHVKPCDVTKIYDALPLFASDIEIASSSPNTLVAEHAMSLGAKMNANLTNVSEIKHKVEDTGKITIMSKDVDVTANYEIIAAEGSIKITKRDIEIKPLEGQSKTYDGRPFITDEVVWTAEDLEGGLGLITTNEQHTVKVAEYTTPSSNWSDSYEWLLKKEDVAIYCGKVDVTANYNIITSDTPTLLSIKKETVYVKPVDVTCVYDAKKHDSTDIEFAKGSVGLTDLGFSIKYDGDTYSFVNRTDEGTTLGHVDGSKIGNIKIYLDKNNVTDNFVINITDAQTLGKVTILKRPINVDPVLVDKVYDGMTLTSNTAISVKEDVENSIGLIEGHTIIASFESSDTVAAEYTWALSSADVIIMSGDSDVTGNYEITCGTASANITKRPITVTPVLADKIYDGTAITSSDVVFTQEDAENKIGLLESLGHKIGAIYTSPSVDVDTYTWELSQTGLKIMADSIDVTASYEIAYGTASADITERTVYVIPWTTKDNKVYNDDFFFADGIMEFVSGQEKTGLLEGHSVSLKPNGENNYIRTEGVDVGDGQSLNLYLTANGLNDISGIEDILDFSDGALAKNYKVIYLTEDDGSTGTVKVNIDPRKVYVFPTLENDNRDKIYDNEYFYAYGIRAQERFGTEGLVNESHTISWKDNSSFKYIHTSTVNVEDGLSLNFYPSGAVTDIEDILEFSEERLRENYKVIFAGTNNNEYIEGTEAVNIKERPVYIIPTVNKADKIYNAEPFYADGVTEFNNRAADEKSGFVLDTHYVTLKSGDKHIHTEGVNVGVDLLLNFYPGGLDIEDILDFSSELERKNYKVIFLGDVGKTCITGTEKVTINPREITLYPVLNYSDENKIYNGDAIEAYITSSIGAVGEKSSWTLANGKTFNVSAEFGEYTNVGKYIWSLSKDASENQLSDVKINNKSTTATEDGVKITLGTTDVTANYLIAYGESAELTITRREVTLTPNLTYSDTEKKYNGDDIVSFITSTLGEDKNQWTLSGNLFTVSAEFGKHSDVGAYTWSLSGDTSGNRYSDVQIDGTPTPKTEAGVTIKHGSIDVTDNYSITYGKAASISVSKRAVTLTPLLDHKGIFNGMELQSDIICDISNKNNWELGSNNLFTVTADFGSYIHVGNYNYHLYLDGTAPKATLTYENSRKIISSDTNNVVIMYSGKDVTHNFNISVGADAQKTINVCEVKVSATVNSKTKVYDNSPFYADGITAVDGLVQLAGHGISFKDEYSHKYIYSNGVAAGSGYILEFVPSGEVQSIEDILEFENEEDRYNYAVSYVNPDYTVTIQKRTVYVQPTVSAADSNKIYDGSYIYANGVVALSGGRDSGLLTKANHGVEQDHALTYDPTSKLIVSADNIAGTHKMISYTQYLNEAITFIFGDTNNYNVVLCGDSEILKVTIKPRPITVNPTVSNTEKTYDAKPFYADGLELAPNSQNSLVEGQHIQYRKNTVYTAQTDVGEGLYLTKYDAGFIKIYNSEGRDVTASYSITYDESKLTVKISPRPITLTPNIESYTKVYDNDYFKVSDIRIVSGSAVNGQNIKYKNGSIKSSGTDVGKYKLSNPSYGDWVNIYDENNNDVSENYKIQYEHVDIEITKRPIYLSPADKKVYYNGKKQTLSTVSGWENLIKGHTGTASDLTFSYEFNGEKTLDGFKGSTEYIESVANVLITGATIVIMDEKNNIVTENYDYSFPTSSYYGYLTVVSRFMTVTPVISDKVYDGDRLKCNSANVTCSDGRDYTISVKSGCEKYSPKADVGTYYFNLSKNDIVIIDNETGETVTDFCIFDFNNVSADITPRPVDIVTLGATKEYDGKALTCNEWKPDPNGNKSENSGFVSSNDMATVSLLFTGKQIDAGSSENYAEVNTQGNYTVNITSFGMLEVTPFKVNIMLYGFSKTYDGNYIDEIDYDFSSTLSDTSIVISHINVVNVSDVFDGEEDMVYSIFLGDNEVDHINYTTIVSVNVNDIICRTKATITFKSNTFDAIYNGTANEDRTLICEGLPAGHRVEGVFVTGSVVGDPDEVIEDYNTISIEDVIIYNSKNEIVTDNFDFDVKPGTITVYPQN